MFSLELECRAEHKDLLIAELWEQGSCGVVELDANHIRAFFEEGAGAARLQKQFRPFGAHLRVEEDRDWVEYSREKWEPQMVGSRFFLVPEWRDDAAPDGRFRIVVNPGLAFGTGIHETTQLCLEALEEYVQPGQTLLDVGTGSGILALAGALLGARPIYACDLDAVAVEVASCNAHVAPSPIRFFVGSVGAMASGCADLLAANISPEAIAALAPELLRVLRPDGRALVSGFERNEADQVKESMTAAGAMIEEARHKGSWALLSTRKLSLLE